jgi:F-type H+-transporting ATPase subunit epsilon
MHLEIITPETKIFNGEANAVMLPGLDGFFQVLKGHAPIISGLSKGVVKVEMPAPLEVDEKMARWIRKDATDQNVIHVEINGGVMELLNDKIIVLAE